VKVSALTHEFVEHFPDELKEGRIYVSIPFATVAHRCCCGCGNEVVTPLSPTAWNLAFDGETVSLDPSIGNWSFPCQSHYWITRNKVTWARRWSQKEIERGRQRDRSVKQAYSDENSTGEVKDVRKEQSAPEQSPPKKRKWKF
jgi:hypothetical protein